MSAEPILTMSEEWVRRCVRHQHMPLVEHPGPKTKLGYGREGAERVCCELCLDEMQTRGHDRIKPPRAFVLVNVRTEQKITCPVDPEDGIVEWE